MDFCNQVQIKRQIVNLRLKKSTVKSFFSLLFFKMVLDLSYYSIIPLYGDYIKFELYFNIVKLIESYFLFLVIFTLMPKSSKKISTIMIWLLILLSYIPMLTVFAFMDRPRIYIYAVTGFWIPVFWLLKIKTRTAIPSILYPQSKVIRNSMFICISTVVAFLVLKNFGFSFNLNLTEVYDTRSQYIAMKIPFAGYLFDWTAYVLNPVFFALFLTKRKRIPVMLIVLFQLLFFSGTGNKTYLFALPFVFVLIWIITRKNPLAWMGTGLIMIVSLGILSFYLLNNDWIYFLFIRRVLLVPAHLSFLYYDFFSRNDFTFLSQHRLFQNFINYPYHLDPPRLIGEFYFNRPEANMNNGIYADAYMNFGFLGLILWMILLVVILRLIDNFSRDKDIRTAIAAVAMPSLILIESALLTGLLTHGILFSLVLLYLLPKTVFQKVNSKIDFLSGHLKIVFRR